MKQITTILLLACFIVFQYGRTVSYWQCQLSNSFKATIEKCDCNQLVNGVIDQSDSNPVPVHHKHVHLDDSFYPPFTTTSKESWLLMQANRGAKLPVFSTLNLASRIDKPPQIFS